MSIDSIAYRIKHTFPAAFKVLYGVARGVAEVCHRRGRQTALELSTIRGTIDGENSVIRPFGSNDVDAVYTFFTDLPVQHLQHFQPHGMDRQSISRVLSSRAYCCYGLYVSNSLAAYCLIKLTPNRNAYVGLLVAPSMTGKGIGKFLWRYLIWQSLQMGLQPCATIHEHNLSSLHSLRSVEDNLLQTSLPGNYLRITISPDNRHAQSPELML